jgi:hypothetical protein
MVVYATRAEAEADSGDGLYRVLEAVILDQEARE